MLKDTPWRLSDVHQDDDAVVDANGYPVAEVPATAIMPGYQERFGIDHWSGHEGTAFIERTAEEVDELRRLFAASPAMKSALEHTLAWLTNVNVNDPATLGRQIMAALENAGHDKKELDDAAVALVRGPCAVPNFIGDDLDDEIIENEEQLEELLEALDNLSAAFETVMAHYAHKMPIGDRQRRWQLCTAARSIVKRYRPDATVGPPVKLLPWVKITDGHYEADGGTNHYVVLWAVHFYVWYVGDGEIKRGGLNLDDAQRACQEHFDKSKR